MDSVMYAREKFQFRRDVGDKEYEVKDHLGNVRVTFNDMKQPINENDLSLGYSLGLESISNELAAMSIAMTSAPFGMQMPGMSWNEGDGYRYGFGSHENDDEVYGDKNFMDFGGYGYDNRLGRRWNVEPKPIKGISSYSVFKGSPIIYTDRNGDTTIVTDKKENFLFSLDDGSKEMTTKTVADIYKEKVQWFEPLADNYMPITSISETIGSHKGIKHFTWGQILKFSEIDRNMLSYAQGGSGDWKEKVADGYYLSTVENFPYWSDAIGQIPFAMDYFTDVYEENGNKDQSISATLLSGMKYGDGTIFGDSDYSNTYDNYFILRGAIWASQRYTVKPYTTWLGNNAFKLIRPSGWEYNSVLPSVSKLLKIKYWPKEHLQKEENEKDTD